jgi:hypothetical protein
MIILGIILIIVGLLVASLKILLTIGIILLVIGLILNFVPIGGRRRRYYCAFPERGAVTGTRRWPPLALSEWRSGAALRSRCWP